LHAASDSHVWKLTAKENPTMKQLGDERGQATIMMSFMMATFLFGFVALAVDVQHMFAEKRMAQAAADAAALAAAEELGNGTSEQNAANAMATANGFNTSAATNPATVTLTTLTSSNYDGSTATLVSNSYVKAVVSQAVPTFFLGALNHQSTMTVSATAVAGGGLSSPSCVCLEGASGMDLNLSNNAKMTATGCGVTIDSSSSNAVGIVGGAKLTAQVIGSVSTNWDNSGNINNGGSIGSGTDVVQGISSSCAPTLPPVPTYNPAQCTADPTSHYYGGQSYSVGPGSTYSTTQQSGTTVCYTSLTVGQNNEAVNLNPGIYVISNGSLHFESGANNVSNTGGNGVIFYLTGTASVTIDNNANVNLTAPSSGTYAGALILQDPGSTTTPTRTADTQTLSIQGGSNANFNGIIYAPTAEVHLGNGSGTTFTADIVASTLVMDGGGTLSSSSTANFGTMNVSTAKLTQ